MVRVLVAVLFLLAGANVLAHVWGRPVLGKERPVLGRARDLETLARRSGSDEVRDRHAVYYRLARELEGVTLHMDAEMFALHGWVLAGLGDVDVVVSRREIVRIRQPLAEGLVKKATYRAQLEGRRLVALLQPGESDYVLAGIGTNPRGSLLLAPLRAFVAAGGAP